MDGKLIAKYPFLTASKGHLGEGGVSELDLKEASFFVEESFKNQEHVYKDEAREAKNLVLSRLMLYSLGIGFLRKFAFRKAREYSRELEKENAEVLIEAARDFFPSIITADGGFRVALVEYLEYGHGLSQAQVSQGKVFFSEQELRACLRQAIETRISDYSKIDSRSLPENIKGEALKLREVIPRDFAPKASSGKLLQRPELQTILKGVGEGKRYYGSMAIAIACVKDGLTREEALEVMQNYVSNCSGGAHPFTPGEGNSVVEWVYRHPSIGFSFQVLKNQGLVD